MHGCWPAGSIVETRRDARIRSPWKEPARMPAHHVLTISSGSSGVGMKWCLISSRQHSQRRTPGIAPRRGYDRPEEGQIRDAPAIDWARSQDDGARRPGAGSGGLQAAPRPAFSGLTRCRRRLTDGAPPVRFTVIPRWRLNLGSSYQGTDAGVATAPPPATHVP